MFPFGKEKTLGMAREKRRYDLPLNKGSGTGFLILLIALMTFLAVLAVAASFALAAMTDRWTSGLENKVTIEIPAETSEGKVLSHDDVRKLTTRVDESLKVHPSVISTHVMSDAEIQDLVRPWLGDDLALNNVPLPGLIAAELRQSDAESIAALERKLKSVAPQTRIDTHEEWLNDLLRFTGAMQFAAIVLSIVIGVTTVTAVAGAVQSRMAVNHTEVELLHLMGAKDHYISRQFQRHSLILALQGALCGLAAGALALLSIDWITGEMGVNLLPDFRLGTAHMIALGSLPLIVSLIATVTTRQTVLKVLGQMP